MKYQFGRNSKKLSSEDIKSHMSFDHVVKASKVFAGVKLTSALLKSGFGSSTAATVGTFGTAAVIATAAIVGPDFVNGDSNTPEPNQQTIEMVAEPEVIDTLVTDAVASDTPLVETQEDDITKAKPVIKKPLQVVQDAPEPEPLAEPEVEKQQAIENKDVLVKAQPLPDLESFLEIIDNDLEYPKEAIKDSVEGFVRVFFKVNKQGIAQDFKINKSLGEAFDNEAIRVLKSHQDWEPASFNGQAVDSYFTIKIQFKYERLDPSNPTKGN